MGSFSKLCISQIKLNSPDAACSRIRFYVPGGRTKTRKPKSSRQLTIWDGGFCAEEKEEGTADYRNYMPENVP